MVVGSDIQTLVTKKHSHEFFDELRKILSNGEVESLSDKATLRLILAALAELYDASDGVSSQVTKNSKDIKDLKSSSIVLRYFQVFKSRPYPTILVTALVIAYIVTWVSHTWSEFLLFWEPILAFITSLL
jgi:hypothetical protein